MLKGRRIVLGITGSISAYKAAEIVSRLTKLSAEVTCVMTKEATHFITPLTLQTLSQNRVYTDLFSTDFSETHISLADKADIILIAPATANIISKLSQGAADDLLSTISLATKAPIIIVPSMNEGMWQNPILQENVARLKRQGFHFVEPETGRLASGKEGKGRLASVSEIIEEVRSVLSRKELNGKHVLITSGPTQEPIDRVRYISNRSTGKMGFSIAEAAKRRGAKVTLISGPTLLPSPNVSIDTMRFVDTCQEMQKEVMSHFGRCDIFVSCAAVADYRPKNPVATKIKKGKEDLFIELERNPDILKDVGKIKGDKILVGFSVDEEGLIERAYEKLKEKNLDMIVANEIEKGFGRDTNKCTLIKKDEDIIDLPLLSKREVAERILDEIVKLVNKGG